VEIGEPVGQPSLRKEFKANCPFKDKPETVPARTGENPADDDTDGVKELQENDGGVLGQNLQAGTKGKADGGPFAPEKDDLYRQPANDSKRGRKSELCMSGYENGVEAGDFPFTVAAHHLIPGGASLYKKDVKLVDFMEDGGKVHSFKGRECTIEGDIGYDVNGSHNGVWLPGNYAIHTARPRYTNKKGQTVKARPSTTPVEDVSWSKLSVDYEEWQYEYVVTAMKSTRSQFHDSHENPYSASVRKQLIKLVVSLTVHMDLCDECKDKTKLPPPYRIKRRLYACSKRLRLYVMGVPEGWKKPWFTSERWSQIYFDGDKLSRKFRSAYAKAIETQPHRVAGDELS